MDGGRRKILCAIPPGTAFSARSRRRLQQTLRAFNCGRTWEIMCADGQALSGYECPLCAGLFPIGDNTCEYCGSPLVLLADLTGRIRERAAERGVKFERVSGNGLNALA